jgi:hypothetical protein
VAREYLDLEVEIAEGKDGVVVRSALINARDTLQLPYADEELEQRRRSVETALRQSCEDRRRGLAGEAPAPAASTQPPEEVVKEFGRELFQALFGGKLGSVYFHVLQEAKRQGKKGLRIKLNILSPRLAALPWEYLFDTWQDDYLALSRSTTLVRCPEVPQPIDPLEVELPLRVLVMAADPVDYADYRLKLEAEQKHVQDAMQPLERDGKVKFTWLAGHTYSDLQRAIRRQGPFHVFYFMGHSRFDGEGWLVLENEEARAHFLRARDLARLLKDHELRLVLLNSCEGARASEQDVFSSVAAGLVRSGVPAVLAMQFAITDAAATEFAHRFFESLADGEGVDVAVTDARISMSVRFHGAPEWGTPVLFLRAADGVLFRVKEEGKPIRRDTEPIPLASSAPIAPAAEALDGELEQQKASGEMEKSISVVTQIVSEVLGIAPQEVDPFVPLCELARASNAERAFTVMWSVVRALQDYYGVTVPTDLIIQCANAGTLEEAAWMLDVFGLAEVVLLSLPPEGLSGEDEKKTEQEQLGQQEEDEAHLRWQQQEWQRKEQERLQREEQERQRRQDRAEHEREEQQRLDRERQQREEEVRRQHEMATPKVSPPVPPNTPVSHDALHIILGIVFFLSIGAGAWVGNVSSAMYGWGVFIAGFISLCAIDMRLSRTEARRELNIVHEGVHYLVVHCCFSVCRKSSEKVRVGAFFYLADGSKMQGSRAPYRAPDGQLTVQSEVDVPYDSTRFEDFQLWLPQSELTIAENCYVTVEITDVATGVALKSAKTEPFNAVA